MKNQNTSWPGWETVRLIGRGSFGAVYEIQRDVLGDIEKAALKVISIPQNASDIDEMYSDGYDDASITSTFRSHLKSIVSEYSLMRKMNGCTNVVNCDDVRYVQHDDGFGWDIYIKMELLTPLTRALPAQVPEETVIRIGKDICTALELCKKHEIVHRDIKPQNIFVSPNGDYKLGDFGIAKTVEKTSGGTKIGTYKYMAPEVYNNQPYGSAADIYSLGLVLYWMLNERRMPFLPLPPATLSAGMDEAARMRRLSGEQLPEPKNGSKQLKAIVMKACAYNVADRYASASDMLKDLNRIGQGYSERLAEPAVRRDYYPVISENEEDKTAGVYGGVVPNKAEVIEAQPEDGTVGMFFKPAEKPSFEKPAASEAVKPAQKADAIPAAEEDGTVGVFFKPAEKPSFEKPAASEAVKPAQKAEAIPAAEEDGTVGLFFKPAEKPSSGKPTASEATKPDVKIAASPVDDEKTELAVETCQDKTPTQQKYKSAEPAPAPKKSKKTLPIIIGAVAAVLAVVITVLLFGLGNGNKTNRPGAPAVDVTLKVWTPLNDQAGRNSWLLQIQKQFQDAHPEYNITWVNEVCAEGDVGYCASTNPALAADVYLFANSCLGELTQAGMIARLDGKYLAQVKKDVSATYVGTVTAPDGGVYGFPVSPNTWFMYYNKSVLTEKDVKSFEACLKKGKVAFPLNNGWYLSSFFFAAGGTMFGESGANASAGIKFGGRVGTNAVNAILDLTENPNFVFDRGDGCMAMCNGSIVAYFSGAWDYDALYAALGKNLGAVAVPTVMINGAPAQLKAFAGSKAVGVNPHADNLEAAMEFAAFLASPDSQLLHFRLQNVTPAASALVNHSEVAASIVAAAEADTMLYASVPQPIIKEMDYTWDPMSNLGNQIAGGKVTRSNAGKMVEDMIKAASK